MYSILLTEQSRSGLNMASSSAASTARRKLASGAFGALLSTAASPFLNGFLRPAVLYRTARDDAHRS